MTVNWARASNRRVGVGEGIFDRILRILDCFTEEEPELSAAQLIERTGLPRSTVHRLTADLLERGLLMRVSPGRYGIGARMWELGELSPLTLRLREPATPHMMRLYEATGENVHLAVLGGQTPQNAYALFVGRVTGRISIPTVSRAGGREPLHATGVGKALLAGRSEAWLAKYFTVPLLAETQQTITDEAELRAELALAQRRGYATTKEEMTLGNVSVAVALPTVQGFPPAAIGLVVRKERADEERLSTFLRNAAAGIARDLRIE